MREPPGRPRRFPEIKCWPLPASSGRLGGRDAGRRFQLKSDFPRQKRATRGGGQGAHDQSEPDAAAPRLAGATCVHAQSPHIPSPEGGWHWDGS